MSNHLTLNFPTLRQDSADFNESVTYEVEATYEGKNILIIRHKLTGQSFISDLIKNGKAKFSVRLYYKDSRTREHHFAEFDKNHSDDSDIFATQTIQTKFSYPEVMANIILLETHEIISNNKSGLSDFWDIEKFTIPEYARIAYYSKLSSGDSALQEIINIKCNEEYDDGAMKTIVSETANEGEKPIILLCARDVFDEVKRINRDEEPTTPRHTVRLAIITQALCAVYAYVQNLPEDAITNNNLLEHLKALKEKTGEDWQDKDNFNPSLAATKMQPYALKT